MVSLKVHAQGKLFIIYRTFDSPALAYRVHAVSNEWLYTDRQTSKVVYLWRIEVRRIPSRHRRCEAACCAQFNVRYVTLQFTRQRRTIRCANVRPQTSKIMASTLTAVTVNFVALMSTIFNATRQCREMWKGMLTVNCLVKFCGRTAAKRTFELPCLSTKMLEHKSFACHAALTGVTSMKVVYSVRRSTAPRIKWLWLHARLRQCCFHSDKQWSYK